MSSSRVLAATSGDPRRPQEAKRYERPVVDPDQQAPDIRMILGSLFGMVGVMLKWKIGAWISLFCILSSVASAKSSEMDIKSLFTSGVFAVIGLVSSYFFPQYSKYRQLVTGGGAGATAEAGGAAGASNPF